MVDRHESRYFPALCPEGHRPFLALVDPLATMQSLRCPVCDAQGRVIPVAYYTLATRERFERVAAILYDARLSREQRATAVAWLDRAARDAEAGKEVVVAALSRVSGLGALSLLVPADSHERHGFVGLVLALLIAGASGPPERGASGAHMLGLCSCEGTPIDERREIEQQAG